MPGAFDLTYHYRLYYRRNTNILAEDFKVIYFNTQKNANSTMKAQFVDVFDLPKTEKFPKDIHYGYKFPAASQLEINAEYQDFLRFSILRNPWERLASCYKNKIAKNSTTGKDYILECSPDLYIGMPFEKFVEVVCEIPDSESDYHFCSQTYLMLYPDGTLPINYFCNMENLGFHIEEIKSRTGIPFRSLAQLNSTKKSSEESFYTPELIEKVRRRYAADIEFFKYEFGEKNETFPFGDVSEDWKKYFSEHPLMLSILKEKNRELLKSAEQIIKNIPPNLEQIMANEKRLQKKIIEIRKSFSWKVTAPLRSLISFFQKKK